MKPVIYQSVVRYFGNTKGTNQTNGSIQTNGCGRFADINGDALGELRKFGVTHVWLTGCLRQATLTDYSNIGLPPDDPDVVKGIAGSFFAVRDCYDVCPDYATNPSSRMQEFEALVARIHDAGLSVIIDFVSNHVSRGYCSVVKPQSTLGLGDDISLFFSPQNHFFYLVEPSGQRLRLSRPADWNPPGIKFDEFDGRFAPEDGSAGHPPKATGDNCTSPEPPSGGWYDTIKLNYGYDFVTQQGIYDPVPRTWTYLDDVLAYWQSKGVDGFRCDFAHYVPPQAWTFLISKARARRPAYFFAEAYFNSSTDPVKIQDELIQAGFDAIYHYQSYNFLKEIYMGGRIDKYDNEMTGQSQSQRAHFVNYLENHDERRVVSPKPIVGQDPRAGGFGSPEAGYQLAPLQFLYSKGAVMLFNGQEVGEPGSGIEGFGHDAGRTTIYDYWTMPEFAKWVNAHQYDGGLLSLSQQKLRRYYAALLQLCQHPSVVADGYWGLYYFNKPEQFADCPAYLYTFARFQEDSGMALVIAANFRPHSGIAGQVRLPRELCQLINFPDKLTIQLILNREGSARSRVASMTIAQLEVAGFPVSIPDQTSHVYWIGPSAS